VSATRYGRYDGDLSMRVSRDGDARIFLAGTLAPADVHKVREVLVALLRDVDRVLVDVSGLALTEMSTLRVFPEAVDRAGGWPAVRLAVVYSGRAMGQALQGSRVARRVAISEEPELALLRCAERPVEVRAQWWFPAASGTLARCRSTAGMRLASWSVPDDRAGRAVFVVNELVSNALQHAGTAVRVGLSLDDDALRVRVCDFNRGTLTGRSGAGFGLAMVDALASRWGFEFWEDGKTVWACLAG
jgi:signal transduction histidine kinase